MPTPTITLGAPRHSPSTETTGPCALFHVLPLFAIETHAARDCGAEETPSGGAIRHKAWIRLRLFGAARILGVGLQRSGEPSTDG